MFHTKRRLYKIIADQAEDINDLKELVDLYKGESNRRGLENMFLHRENQKLRKRADAMTPIQERRRDSEKKE